MITHKGTWFVHKARSYHDEDYYVETMDMSNCGHVLLNTQDFEVDIETPTKDPIEAEIQMLANEADRLGTEAYAKVQNIKDRIKQLQCLEYKPEVAG